MCIAVRRGAGLRMIPKRSLVVFGSPGDQTRNSGHATARDVHGTPFPGERVRHNENPNTVRSDYRDFSLPILEILYGGLFCTK
jgi:hypothetical protein